MILIDEAKVQHVLDVLEENHHLIEEHERPEYLAHYDLVITILREAMEQKQVPYSALARSHLFRHFDFQQTPPYFRYDTDDNTAKENESTLWEMQEELRELGFELIDTQVEHDCITGNLSRVKASK